MISFEECQKRAERILEFARRSSILDKAASESIDGAEILVDKSEADRISWDQDDESIEYWSVLRGKEYAKLNEIGEKWPTQKCTSELFKLLEGISIPSDIENLLSGVRDELATDMWYCYLNEVRGGSSALFNSILNAYEQNGWPCGWRGKFPDGNLIVLNPNPAK
jgi:hypothetical protein